MKKELYYFDFITKEYTNKKEIDTKFYGVNIPNTTHQKPLEEKEGFAVCFNVEADEWEYLEDNRKKTVYSKLDQSEIVVDYIGAIKDEHTLLKPAQFDKWSVDKWVEDTTDKEKYEESQAKEAKEKELNELTIDHNTVFYDAHQEAIGNMGAVIGIANATFNKAISVGVVTEEGGEPVILSLVDAYNFVYKQTVTWKGADNKPHTVQIESLVEASQKAMEAKAAILFKY